MSDGSVVASVGIGARAPSPKAEFWEPVVLEDSAR